MKNYFVWLLLLLPLLATGCYGEEEKEDGPGDYIWDFINYNTTVQRNFLRHDLN